MENYTNKKMFFEERKIALEVSALFQSKKEDLGLEIIAGESGLSRKLISHELGRPGLALCGFTRTFAFERVQLFGETEYSYMCSLEDNEVRLVLENLFTFPIPCMIFTNGNRPPEKFLKMAGESGIPLMVTNTNTAEITTALSDHLYNYFTPKATIHASLVDVYGVGMLYTGKSGIGKSECVLDLVERGHRLVADDIVTITKSGHSLIGEGSELLGHHMEIRGIGIIDIKSLFGIRAIRMRKKIEVEVELVEWDSSQKYERMGLDDNNVDILGVEIPKVKIPVSPGKNITVISEVIAMNNLLKMNGINPALEFNKKLIKTMQKKYREKADRKSLRHDIVD
ncbi:MAG: HPr(Ser) kinase/phosphatase [Fibrobacterota bacterium]